MRALKSGGSAKTEAKANAGVSKVSKAVILCAGKSTRAYPLTLSRPKALLMAGGKTLIEHTLDRLEGVAKEAILVVSEGGQIEDKIGQKHGILGIKYAIQKKAAGTGNALLQAENLIGRNERFLVMMGDNLYPADMIKACASYGLSILGQEVGKTEDFGVIESEDGFLKSIIEKPQYPVSNVANTSLYVLDGSVFKILKALKSSSRNEYELTDAVSAMAKEASIRCFKTDEWVPVTYPWDLLAANRSVLACIKTSIQGDVEKHVVIKGEVIVGRNTIVKSGTTIEGPVFIGERCVIGPNAYIRPDTAIGNDVRFRGEVVDSIIMDNTTAKHNCYIGHSVIGENVNIAAGTVTADYRHDGKEHSTIVKDKMVHTGLKKLGAFIGDNVRTGINTSIYPGRKIWPSLSTRPAEVVDKDRME